MKLGYALDELFTLRQIVHKLDSERLILRPFCLSLSLIYTAPENVVQLFILFACPSKEGRYLMSFLLLSI